MFISFAVKAWFWLFTTQHPSIFNSIEMRNYDELPQEIIFDIMWRVPAKSVGLCRCVSKNWLDMLSQSDFVQTHLQITKIKSLESLVITDSTDVEPDVYLAPLNNAHQLFDEITLSSTKLSFSGYIPPTSCVYTSCDGLLLAITYGEMAVTNPLTREIMQVPPSPLALDALDNNVNVAFCYGFGYDSLTDDYKIAIISFCYGETYSYVIGTFFDVYSLKFGSWKGFESSPFNYKGLALSVGAFVGGCLHWLHTTPTDDKLTIVAFDLVAEKFREFPLPNSICDNLEGLYSSDLFQYKLGVLEGCLCMSYRNEQGELWVMKEYGISKSWTKFVVNHYFGVFQCFLSSQEQVVMKFLELYDDNHVMWNPKQRLKKRLCSMDSVAIQKTSVLEQPLLRALYRLSTIGSAYSHVLQFCATEVQ